MNNSKIAFDNLEKETDRTSVLEKERGRLARIVEAINGVESSDEWQKLKSLVFNNVLETLEKQLKDEASKLELNAPEIYRLQGQLLWARKYLDLKEFVRWYKYQLENINNQINEQNNPRDGAL